MLDSTDDCVANVFSWCKTQVLCYSRCLHPPSRSLEHDAMMNADELNERLKLVARQRSREIEVYLRECRRGTTKAMKILLLGGPACGKSTIFKQMQIIHKEGFKRADQLAYFKELINDNIRTSFEQLVEGASKLQIPLDTEELTATTISSRFAILQGDVNAAPRYINHSLAVLLQRFWISSPAQAVYAQRHTVELLDSCKYFLDNVMRIAADDWMPTEDDILHSRQTTLTIAQTTFTYNGCALRMVDVGAQRSQRRKWLHLFDDTMVILYIVDLTGYAKTNNEHCDVCDIPSALSLFNEVSSSRALRRAIFVLFLNKADLFRELLETVPFSTAFDQYEGENNFEETGKFLEQKFLEAAKPRKSVFPHFTTATNTDNVKFVFGACMESVFRAGAKSTGLT